MENSTIIRNIIKKFKSISELRLLNNTYEEQKKNDDVFYVDDFDPMIFVSMFLSIYLSIKPSVEFRDDIELIEIIKKYLKHNQSVVNSILNVYDTREPLSSECSEDEDELKFNISKTWSIQSCEIINFKIFKNFMTDGKMFFEIDRAIKFMNATDLEFIIIKMRGIQPFHIALTLHKIFEDDSWIKKEWIFLNSDRFNTYIITTRGVWFYLKIKTLETIDMSTTGALIYPILTRLTFSFPNCGNESNTTYIKKLSLIFVMKKITSFITKHTNNCCDMDDPECELYEFLPAIISKWETDSIIFEAIQSSFENNIMENTFLYSVLGFIFTKKNHLIQVDVFQDLFELFNSNPRATKLHRKFPIIAKFLLENFSSLEKEGDYYKLYRRKNTKNQYSDRRYKYIWLYLYELVASPLLTNEESRRLFLSMKFVNRSGNHVIGKKRYYTGYFDSKNKYDIKIMMNPELCYGYRYFYKQDLFQFMSRFISFVAY